MTDNELKPCPFCGNPAEIVPCDPPEWHILAKHVVIRCSSEFCMMHDHGMVMLRACVEDYCNTLKSSIAEWNTRKRRRKVQYED